MVNVARKRLNWTSKDYLQALNENGITPFESSNVHHFFPMFLQRCPLFHFDKSKDIVTPLNAPYDDLMLSKANKILQDTITYSKSLHFANQNLNLDFKCHSCSLGFGSKSDLDRHIHKFNFRCGVSKTSI